MGTLWSSPVVISACPCIGPGETEFRQLNSFVRHFNGIHESLDDPDGRRTDGR